MRWQIGWQGTVLAIVLFCTGLYFGSNRHAGDPIHSTAGERLQPAASVPGESTISGTIYVPVYSTLHLGVANRAGTVDLGATVSVRNVSTVHSITLDW